MALYTKKIDEQGGENSQLIISYQAFPKTIEPLGSL